MIKNYEDLIQNKSNIVKLNIQLLPQMERILLELILKNLKDNFLDSQNFLGPQFCIDAYLKLNVKVFDFFTNEIKFQLLIENIYEQFNQQQFVQVDSKIRQRDSQTLDFEFTNLLDNVPCKFILFFTGERSIRELSYENDYTINSLYLDINRLVYFSFLGGIEDLENKMIKLVKSYQVTYYQKPEKYIDLILMKERFGLKADNVLIIFMRNTDFCKEVIKRFQKGQKENLIKKMRDLFYQHLIQKQREFIMNTGLYKLLTIDFELGESAFRETFEEYCDILKILEKNYEDFGGQFMGKHYKYKEDQEQIFMKGRIYALAIFIYNYDKKWSKNFFGFAI